jgi:hypothetical protein
MTLSHDADDEGFLKKEFIVYWGFNTDIVDVI